MPATFAAKRDQMPETILGKVGFFLLDLSVPVVEGTYAAALSSANCALSAAQEIVRSSTADATASSSFLFHLLPCVVLPATTRDARSRAEPVFSTTPPSPRSG
jgi:hypothetical protein